MQITHEEAKRLIQTEVDGRLYTIDLEKLTDHLSNCAECRGYRDAIRETEDVLQAALQKQWKVSPLPLQMETIYTKINSSQYASPFLTTRRLLAGLVTIMLVFMAWQSVANSFRQIPSTIPLIPTPSLQHTVTNTFQQNKCDEIRYFVQNSDTLDSIANHFSITKEALLHANNLASESIFTGQELIVPVCKSTPTSTTHPPTFTITPIFETTSTSSG